VIFYHTSNGDSPGYNTTPPASLSQVAGGTFGFSGNKQSAWHQRTDARGYHA